MRLLLILALTLISGCATTYSLVRVEKHGPVEAEIWRNNKTRTCERRVYLDSMYYHTDIPCEKVIDINPVQDESGVTHD